MPNFGILKHFKTFTFILLKLLQEQFPLVVTAFTDTIFTEPCSSQAHFQNTISFNSPNNSGKSLCLVFCLVFVFVFRENKLNLKSPRNWMTLNHNLVSTLHIVLWYFYNWIYWGEIGSQNHTRFKYTTQQNIIYTMHPVPIAQSRVPFQLHFPPFCPPPPTPTPFPLAATTLLSVSKCYIYAFLLNPFTFFHPAPQTSSPLTPVSLFCVYISLFLFYSSFYFVH